MLGYKSFMLKVYDKDKNPMGDLARDIKGDKDFPNLSVNKKEIQNYLDYSGACSGAIEAFEESWAVYAAYKKSEKEYEPKQNRWRE